MPLTHVKIYPENLNLSIKKWHVEYRFPHPETGKKKRFKVYEDIDRQNGPDKVKYAKDLRETVKLALLNGYNPFAAEIKVKEQVQQQRKQVEQAPTSKRGNYSIIQALNYFLAKSQEGGASKSTLDRYKSHCKLLKQWLNENEMLIVPASEITADHILTFLSENNEKHNWENKTYNNYLVSMQTAFNLLAKKIHAVIPCNPIEGATTKTTLSRKHAAYSDEQLITLLTNVRKNKDAFMEGIILSVYYACIRSKAELRQFKIGNILFDRDLIRLDAEGTKGRRDDHIPLDPVLKMFYLEQGFDKLPRHW